MQVEIKKCMQYVPNSYGVNAFLGQNFVMNKLFSYKQCNDNFYLPHSYFVAFVLRSNRLELISEKQHFLWLLVGQHFVKKWELLTLRQTAFVTTQKRMNLFFPWTFAASTTGQLWSLGGSLCGLSWQLFNTTKVDSNHRHRKSGKESRQSM